MRGSAPGTRETDFMSQGKAVQECYAVLLAGGSAFGLAAADGVMIYCEQQGMGVRTDDAVIPVSYTHLDVYKRQAYGPWEFTADLISFVYR